MENNNENAECCCSHKTKKRSEEEYRKLVNRLNRIEGQVRGVLNGCWQRTHIVQIS